MGIRQAGSKVTQKGTTGVLRGVKAAAAQTKRIVAGWGPGRPWPRTRAGPDGWLLTVLVLSSS